MGLDGVEIVMAVEEAFSIQIEDSEAEKVLTPGHLINLILAKTTVATAEACLTLKAFHLLRSFWVRQYAAKRSQVKPTAPLRELLPRSQRVQFVQDLANALSIKPPALVRPQSVKALLMLAVALSGLGITVLAMHLGANSWLPALLGMPVVAFFGSRGTQRLKTEFPPELTTVGDLSGWIMACKPGLAVSEVSGWAREQVAARVKKIVIDTLGCDSSYREDARFIEDLGLS